MKCGGKTSRVYNFRAGDHRTGAQSRYGQVAVAAFISGSEPTSRSRSGRTSQIALRGSEVVVSGLPHTCLITITARRGRRTAPL